MSERNVLSQIESSTKTNLSISAKELFLRFVDPEHHKIEKPRLTEEQQQNKLLKLDSENKLIEQCNNEFLKTASDNLKKINKTDFYCKLQELNDKILIFKTLQNGQNGEDQSQNISVFSHHRKDKNIINPNLINIRSLHIKAKNIKKRKVRPKSIREQKICTLELTQEGIQENNSIKMSTSFNSHSDENDHKEKIHDHSEYQPSDIISEKDGEISP